MEINEFIDILQKEFNIKEIDTIKEKILKYKTYLVEKNKVMNLTRLDDPKIIYKQYFLESIYPYKNFEFTDKMKVLDIGSGSGIPGIVLKILYPNIDLTIIEPIKKRCEFLNGLVNELGLTNVLVLNDRAEIYGKKNREIFDLVTCRAVAELKVIIEIGFPLCKTNGTLIFPKGQNHNIEYENAKLILSKIGHYELNVENQSFYDKNLINYVFIKKEKTPLIFPREWKDIIK